MTAAPIPPIELQRQWISECPKFADWRPFTGDPVRVGTDWAAVIAKAAAWGYGERGMPNSTVHDFDNVPHAYAAEIRAIADWLVPEEDPEPIPIEEQMAWVTRMNLRERLLFEADRAEAGMRQTAPSRPLTMPEGTPLDPRRAGEDQPVQPPTPRLEKALEPESRAYPTCQMPPEKFQNYWRYYNNDLDAHRSAVWTLYDQIRALPGGVDVLDSSALWVEKWNEKPPEPAWPVVFDPWGPDEQGMAGPKIQIKLNKNDSCIVVNDKTEKMTGYDAYGKKLWSLNCLARGQGSDTDWKSNSSDTPPGAYKAGAVYRDYDQYGSSPGYDGTLQSYGWYSIDLVELEGQEAVNGRAGIMNHGGGSACGWPGAWAPNQRLYPTLGCVRSYNVDLRDKIVPLCDKGTVYYAVFQEQR